jgi:hypothetical protein
VFHLMVIFMHFGALSGAAAEFDNATAGRTPACVLSLRSGWGGGIGGKDGREKLGRLIVQLGSQCLPTFIVAQCWMHYFSMKKYGEVKMLNMMAPSKMSENWWLLFY